MPNNSRKEVIIGVIFVGLLAAVTVGRQVWRLSHREGTPLFSVETFQAYVPYLVAGIVLIVVLIAWDWLKKRGKARPDIKDQ